uniref:Uncharacterized protein n=1 Tax=Plectus sambesii TaxID=2011161 RepID=A0A914UKZ7_9BILA
MTTAPDYDISNDNYHNGIKDENDSGVDNKTTDSHHNWDRLLYAALQYEGVEMEQKLNGVTQKVAQYAKKYGEIVGVGGTDASSWMAKLALKWLLMKTFWLIIFAIFSVWTVQSGAALVERYVAADTISVLTVVNNQPFAVPKGTVCLPIYGFTLDELFQKENGSTTSVKEYFSMKSMTKEKFLENGGDLLWPRTVMDYLTTMSLVEAGEWWQAVLAFSTNYSIMTLNEDDGWEPGYKELSWIGYFNYFMMRDYLNEDSWNAQFLLEDFLNQLGVSVEELKQALGRKIIKLFSLTAAHYTDGSEEMQDKTVNMLYDVIGRYATSMQQNIAKMDNADFNTITELGWNKTFVISVQASYKAMPVVKGKKQCSEDSTRNLRQ